MLEVGAILKPHGLKGALTIYSYTRPASGIAGYSFWWLGDTPEAARRYQVSRCWQHGKRMLVELDSIDDCARAEKLKGQKIWVPADQVERDDDEYLWEELIGFEVFVDQSNALLGTVVALEEYGAQDILTVRASADAARPGEWLLPFIGEVVLDVDSEARRITVTLPEGMDACFTPSC